MYFNDLIKAVYTSTGDNFVYVERRKTSTGGVREPVSMYTLTHYPEETLKLWPWDWPIRMRSLCSPGGKWMKHSLAYNDNKEGKRKIGYRPIHYYTLDEDECKTVLLVTRVW